MMTKNINLEKISEYNYFLLLTSFVLFIDSYLIVTMDVSITHLTFDLLKSNIGKIIIMLWIFSFFMAIVSKIVSWLVNTIYRYNFDSNDHKISDKNFIFEDQVFNWAVINNNSTLYAYYQEHKQNIQLIYKTGFLATGSLSLLLINYAVSSDSSLSVTRVYELLESQYTNYFVTLNWLFAGVVFYMGASALTTGNHYYIHLDKEVQNYLFNETKSIEYWHGLLKDGAITQEEYEDKKQSLL